MITRRLYHSRRASAAPIVSIWELNMNKLFRNALLAGGLLASPTVVWAYCTTDVGGITPIPFTLYNFNPPSFNPNVPVGSIIYSQTVLTGTIATTGFTCPGGIGVIFWRGTTSASAGPYNAYSTPINGIGLRFQHSYNNKFFPFQGEDLGQATRGVLNSHTVTVSLVKTGPITAGGTISGEIAGVFAQYNTSQIASFRLNSSVQIKPMVPTCRVSTPAIKVPLGKVHPSTFTGVGTYSPAQNFNIGLTCSGGTGGTVTRVYTTLTDQTNPGNRSNTLPLISSGLTATGVGIQILNGSTPISYGPDSRVANNPNQWMVGTQGNGSFTIPLSVRYVQTSPSVTPGTANGAATFTMSYQ